MSGGGGRGRILAVDDNPQNVALLEGQLRRAGYEVIAATSGEAALEAAHKENPDVVLLDVLMPGLDGYEVCRRLREAETTRALPVVMLTALRDSESQSKALKAGADDFLSKPFDRTELLARVATLIRSKRLYDEVAKSRDEIMALNATLEQRVAERTAQLQQALADVEALHQQALQQERLRAVGEMASGVAHDLNNALAPVVGFAELLLEQPAALANLETARRYLRLILTGATDAAETVRRLREVYRPREDDERVDAVELDPLMRQAVELTRPKWKDQAQAAGASISVEVEAEGAPVVTGAAAELREALINLIFNAVDAMPHGGTITLRARPHRGRKRVLVSVSDTGMGMTEEIRQRALDPFFTTKGERGTGLGLAMVHGIVTRHNGRLHIDSRPGEGTTISLDLPARQESDATDSPATPTADAVGRSLTILLVDDEPLVRAVTSAALVHDGHTVVEARDAAEAREIFAEAPASFDLVITDRAMPAESGDQLALHLKERNPSLPVIMLTGFGSLMGGAPTPAVDAVLGKPVSRRALRAAISSLLDHS